METIILNGNKYSVHTLSYVKGVIVVEIDPKSEFFNDLSYSYSEFQLRGENNCISDDRYTYEQKLTETLHIIVEK